MCWVNDGASKGTLLGITDFVASLEQYLPVVEDFYESIRIAATDFAGALLVHSMASV